MSRTVRRRPELVLLRGKGSWGAGHASPVFIANFSLGRSRLNSVWREVRYPRGRASAVESLSPPTTQSHGSTEQMSSVFEQIQRSPKLPCRFQLRHVVSHAIFTSLALLSYLRCPSSHWESVHFLSVDVFNLSPLSIMENNVLASIRLNYMKLMIFNHFLPTQKGKFASFNLENILRTCCRIFIRKRGR